ncbi:MAG: hypothetical protein IPK00_23030 [Deltaproteobacteria bacterium]|nr:hypothetical protein [Deltaproteobacteria bacterium]
MSHITRYSLMPIPPLEAHTHWFEAGGLKIGVEYRLLTDAIAAAVELESANGDVPGVETDGPVDDRGVSLHVFGRQDGEEREFLRFDCFQEDPHYHYVSWRAKSNEMIHLDPIADGDPLAWALDRLRSRLLPMLIRAGAADVAKQVDVPAVDALLPRIAETAFRLRFAQHDELALHAEALRAGARR